MNEKNIKMFGRVAIPVVTAFVALFLVLAFPVLYEVTAGLPPLASHAAPSMFQIAGTLAATTTIGTPLELIGDSLTMLTTHFEGWQNIVIAFAMVGLMVFLWRKWTGR